MKVRRLVRRQADVAAAVALQTPAAVESRPPAADQFQLTQLDTEFMGTRFPDHLPSMLGNPLFLGTIIACGEVGQQPIAELGRHPDVDELAFTIQHSVHAWGRRAQGAQASPHFALLPCHVQGFQLRLVVEVRRWTKFGEGFSRRCRLPQHAFHDQRLRLRDHQHSVHATVYREEQEVSRS